MPVQPESTAATPRTESRMRVLTTVRAFDPRRRRGLLGTMKERVGAKTVELAQQLGLEIFREVDLLEGLRVFGIGQLLGLLPAGLVFRTLH